jgi:4-hydroxy-tetrahydrodipicolinate reductase
VSPRAVQYGVDPIGALTVETAVQRGYEFVGAVDIDPGKVGEDLGTVVGLDRELGVEVSDDPADALDENPDVVFHSTTSSIESARPQIEASMAAGADVVSTCEELSYPWRDNPDAANAIDGTANEYGQTCLGTGINPGFAMDTLPSVTSTACQWVDRLLHR